MEDSSLDISENIRDSQFDVVSQSIATVVKKKNPRQKKILENGRLNKKII